MSKIKSIIASEILDSRDNPTIETRIILDDKTTACASIPGGASLSDFEAVELRDKDPTRFGGMGVIKAVNNVNTIIGPRLLDHEVTDQTGIDQTLLNLDNSSDKSKLGSNSLLSVSLACARTASLTLKMPLYKYLNTFFEKIQPTVIARMPTPIFNIINGGKHGAGNLDFQEFHLIPSSVKRYYQGLRLAVEIYDSLKDLLVTKNYVYSVGDEGGFGPNCSSNLEGLDLILEAIKKTSYVYSKDCFLGLDLAASQFKDGNGYKIKDKNVAFSSLEFIDFLKSLNDKYRILLLEDPLAEDDENSWQKLTETLKATTIIVGDDLLATNVSRIKNAVSKKLCTAALIKPNQIGTLTETLAAIKEARAGGLKIIVSHRSGETNDDFIADLAVAVQSDYVKFGAPVRGERVAKYNRLWEIERELNL